MIRRGGSIEPGQYDHQPGKGDHCAGPEDEHPLDEIGALAGHLRPDRSQAYLHFSADFRQALLQTGLEARKILIRNLTDGGPIHGSRLIPPGEQIVGGFVSEGFMEPLEQSRGNRQAPNLKLRSDGPASKERQADRNTAEVRRGRLKPMLQPLVLGSHTTTVPRSECRETRSMVCRPA